MLASRWIEIHIEPLRYQSEASIWVYGVFWIHIGANDVYRSVFPRGGRFADRTEGKPKLVVFTKSLFFWSPGIDICLSFYAGFVVKWVSATLE